MIFYIPTVVEYSIIFLHINSILIFSIIFHVTLEKNQLIVTPIYQKYLRRKFRFHSISFSIPRAISHEPHLLSRPTETKIHTALIHPENQFQPEDFSLPPSNRKSMKRSSHIPRRINNPGRALLGESHIYTHTLQCRLMRTLIYPLGPAGSV